ncbi:phosphoribosylaminoimidazole carboxylase [Cylindrobasidium torrendii FP15055 ss-10]|uniref:Phosphoribosylaminoimidazole carboxylase n=1 Tax=Cylindrobasidium torrendii FP15055 ss-10 TaxID=1314674 RepID=A0A0D7BEV9_9AGAR|nr:phosphoribosylaminoimidazole carboxylase [Cylindrobasidium torrendii FP15055 ss-10]
MATTKTVGVLGERGGQLGRMLGASASLLNIPIVFLDSGNDTPAKLIVSSSHVDGSFKDPEKIRLLAEKCDVLTVEIEHVDVDALDAVAAEFVSRGLQVHPHPNTIRIIQDKFLQKDHLTLHACPLGRYLEVTETTIAGITHVAERMGLPLMLKSRTQAYDGRGNYALKSLDDVGAALEALGGGERKLYAEAWVPFDIEIAVMVVRGANGEVKSYPPVQTIHKDSICHLVFAPLRNASADKARDVAERAVGTFQGAGVFGVEMFLLANGELLINEIAPRPHNSGHYTIEACETSQYENHLRAILSLPLGSTAMAVPAAGMLNLIPSTKSPNLHLDLTTKALSIPSAHVHLYAKAAPRAGRKMGHITITAPTDDELRNRLRPLLDEDDAERYCRKLPLVAIVMGSDSDLGVMKAAAQMLDEFGVPYELTLVSAHRTPARLTWYARSAVSRGIRVIIAGAGGAAHLPGMVAAQTPLPVIGVPVKSASSPIDGSDALWSIVQMPKGIPVATVAINGAANAALLAVRMLGMNVEMEAYLRKIEGEVLTKIDSIEELGWEAYMKK